MKNEQSSNRVRLFEDDAIRWKMVALLATQKSASASPRSDSHRAQTGAKSRRKLVAKSQTSPGN